MQPSGHTIVPTSPTMLQENRNRNTMTIIIKTYSHEFKTIRNTTNGDNRSIVLTELIVKCKINATYVMLFYIIRRI